MSDLSKDRKKGSLDVDGAIEIFSRISGNFRRNEISYRKLEKRNRGRDQ